MMAYNYFIPTTLCCITVLHVCIVSHYTYMYMYIHAGMFLDQMVEWQFDHVLLDYHLKLKSLLLPLPASLYRHNIFKS
jgi:hypothetical protein